MKIRGAFRKAYLPIAVIFSLLVSCNEKPNNTTAEADLISNENLKNADPKTVLSQAFKDYWYAGEAELTSYKLEQARYGELRDGHAVLVYVSEDFNVQKQVKADRSDADNISVLKLNVTKKFNTGIYPYSVMQSTFYPVSNAQHAIKVTSSMQEWCGQVFTQLNNRTNFEVQSYSYFESEGDQELQLEKAILENELWTQLRIDPKSLPQGDQMIIPSFEFMRLKHVDIKAYKASAFLSNDSYTLNYYDLDRSITINFNSEFPHEITGWEETFNSGFGPEAQPLTTKATLMKSIKSAYWGKNSNADSHLRDSLQLQ